MMRLPVSCVSSAAARCRVPAVSCVVCAVGVCLPDATVSQAKTAKLVEMPFAGQTLVGRMNLVSDGGAHWRRVRMLPAATGGVVWSVCV